MKIGRVKDEMWKVFKRRGLLLSIIFLPLLLFIIYSTYINNKSYPIVINGKTYSCATLPKEDEKALGINAELVSSLRETLDTIMKRDDENISLCGTEKEYKASPEVEEKMNKLIPSDVQVLLDEYRRTKTYTINDFQECRKSRENAKKEDYDRGNSGIKVLEDYEKKILTKNNCRIHE